jgi:hypothetical protein
MTTATCCLPLVIPTRTPWHRRLLAALQAQARAAWAAARRASERQACRAMLRRLPRETLRDIGLAECVHDEPTLPRVDWEYGRWN